LTTGLTTLAAGLEVVFAFGATFFGLAAAGLTTFLGADLATALGFGDGFPLAGAAFRAGAEGFAAFATGFALDLADAAGLAIGFALAFTTGLGAALAFGAAFFDTALFEGFALAGAGLDDFELF